MDDKKPNFDRYSITSKLPRKRFLSLFIVVCILIAYMLLPLLGKNISSINPGPLTPSHAMLTGDCRSCHQAPLATIQDSACLTCHKITDHYPNDIKLNIHHGGLDSQRCIDCHTEHHGKDSLLPRQSSLCVKCHSEISSVAPETKLPNIPSWHNHPEFQIGEGSKGDLRRAPLSDQSIDLTHIKLNHSVHLKENIRGDKGKETLQCISCHELSKDRKLIEPIKFEMHCHRCHSLGFDEHITSEAPHGDPNRVYSFLYSEFAKSVLAKNDPASSDQNSKQLLRQVPGKQSTESERLLANRIAVENASRSAEELLFTKTGCFLCHDTAKKDLVVQDDKMSRFEVMDPKIPTQWLNRAHFNHGSHTQVNCSSCHPKAKESKMTRDVLLPRVDSCKECHTQNSSNGVRSECIDCHSFHDSLSLDDNKKKSLHEILKK